MHDLAETEREIGDEVNSGDDLEHRQLGERRQGVGEQGELGRSGPGAFEIDILQMVFDQLAYARRAIDMRYDLEQEVGCRQRGFDRGEASSRRLSGT